MIRASRPGTARKRIGVTLIVAGMIGMFLPQLLRFIPSYIEGGGKMHWVIGVIVAFFVVFTFPMLSVGAFLFWRGRQYAAKADAEKIVTDSKPDVLYLRSFRSDPSTARYVFRSAFAWEYGFTTEEEQLADVLLPFGNLVAIGRPGERLPEPGAARIYASDEEWKEVVEGQMQAARLVVIRAGVGENLLWEAKHALETLNPQKLLVLVMNMKAQDYETFCTKVNPILDASLPEAVTTEIVSGFIVFAPDWKPSFLPLPPPDFGMSIFSGRYRASFKLALRPVFERFGVRWQPPPAPVADIAVLAILALSTQILGLWVLFSPRIRHALLLPTRH